MWLFSSYLIPSTLTAWCSWVKNTIICGGQGKNKKAEPLFQKWVSRWWQSTESKTGSVWLQGLQTQDAGLAPHHEKWCSVVLSCSVVSHSFATPWSVSHQAPLSMGFPRQEYWSGLPCPSPGDLPELGIGTEAGPRTQQADFSPVWASREANGHS